MQPVVVTITVRVDINEYPHGTDAHELAEAMIRGEADWPERITIHVQADDEKQ